MCSYVADPYGMGEEGEDDEDADLKALLRKTKKLAGVRRSGNNDTEDDSEDGEGRLKRPGGRGPGGKNKGLMYKDYFGAYEEDNEDGQDDDDDEVSGDDEGLDDDGGEEEEEDGGEDDGDQRGSRGEHQQPASKLGGRKKASSHEAMAEMSTHERRMARLQVCDSDYGGWNCIAAEWRLKLYCCWDENMLTNFKLMVTNSASTYFVLHASMAGADFGPGSTGHRREELVDERRGRRLQAPAQQCARSRP